jgi:hypothetical protein
MTPPLPDLSPPHLGWKRAALLVALLVLGSDQGLRPRVSTSAAPAPHARVAAAPVTTP